MTDPVFIWRGKIITEMTREELITAMNQACGLLRQYQEATSRTISTFRELSDRRARLKRVDGIFLGLVIGTTAGAILASVLWAFFLLT